MKTFFNWFTHKENILVCLMVALILTVHLVYIEKPPILNTSVDPPTRNYLGDEVFYVTEANHFLAGDIMERPEHPPVAKWLIAGGIFIFGDNPIGWRSFPIFFGMISIFLFYFICLRLARRESSVENIRSLFLPKNKRSKWFRVSTFVPLLATFLFATENMNFVMSHIAMLDVFCITFMLLGFLLYLRGNYLFCGIAMGLSMLCKAMALLAVLVLVIHLLFTRRAEISSKLKQIWNTLINRPNRSVAKSDILRTILIFLAVCVTWFTLIPVLQYPVVHQWVSPLKSTIDMLTTHLSLNDAGYGSPSGIASNPWMWLIWPDGIYYWYDPRYLLAIGWTVWIMVMPSMAYLIYFVARYRNIGREVAWFALSWFAGVYGLLIVLKLTTGRLMYHFYFYPAIPAVCLATAWGAWRLWQYVQKKGRKSRIGYAIGLSVYLAATVATFVFMSPLGTYLIPLPT
jgi:predicted membrane-bound dolichyl-phosphate-mannose-protein mannosyltransferase